MNSHYFIAFSTAFLTAFLAVEHAPSEPWGWIRTIGAAVLQGMIAIKALQTDPDQGKKEKPVEVTTPPGKPLPVVEAASVILIVMLLTGCQQDPPRLIAFRSGPVTHHFIDGYSSTLPKPWPMTAENSEWSQEMHYRAATAYLRNAESIPEYLDHELKGLP